MIFAPTPRTRAIAAAWLVALGAVATAGVALAQPAPASAPPTPNRLGPRDGRALAVVSWQAAQTAKAAARRAACPTTTIRRR
jgi:hypothetical protein